MRKHVLLVFVFALVVSACGGTSSSAAGELEVCAWNGVPNWAEEPVNAVNLRANFPDHSAGDLVTFDWEIDEGVSEVVVGDEWLVTCFNGQDVNPVAWQANGVFGDEPNFTLPSEGLGGDDDGWDPLPATVAVPPDAPRGFYTVRVEGVVFGADGESLGVTEFDASFLIVAAG